MALWLVRAGRHGEDEKKFLGENRVYLTWDGLSHDLGSLKNRTQLRVLLEKVYPDAPKGWITNNLGQIWAFSQGIAKGDWVVLPSKQKPAIHSETQHFIENRPRHGPEAVAAHFFLADAHATHGGQGGVVAHGAGSAPRSREDVLAAPGQGLQLLQDVHGLSGEGDDKKARRDAGLWMLLDVFGS